MSGGHFEYQQYRIEDIAVEIDEMIGSNDDQSLDEWGQRRGKNYPPEIIEKFREAAHTLRQAAEMAQRVDWLVSGDDGEDSFMRRWGKEVRPYWHNACPCAGEPETTMKKKLKSSSPLDAAARSHLRAWRSTVERFVEYQPECSNHGGIPIIALPCHTMTEAIDHCIRWREEGACGKFTVTTRRKEVEEIFLCENA